MSKNNGIRLLLPENDTYLFLLLLTALFYILIKSGKYEELFEWMIKYIRNKNMRKKY